MLLDRNSHDLSFPGGSIQSISTPKALMTSDEELELILRRNLTREIDEETGLPHLVDLFDPNHTIKFYHPLIVGDTCYLQIFIFASLSSRLGSYDGFEGSCDDDTALMHLLREMNDPLLSPGQRSEGIGFEAPFVHDVIHMSSKKERWGGKEVWSEHTPFIRSKAFTTFFTSAYQSRMPHMSPYMADPYSSNPYCPMLADPMIALGMALMKDDEEQARLISSHLCHLAPRIFGHLPLTPSAIHERGCERIRDLILIADGMESLEWKKKSRDIIRSDIEGHFMHKIGSSGANKHLLLALKSRYTTTQDRGSPLSPLSPPPALTALDASHSPSISP